MDSTYPQRRAEHVEATSDALTRVFNAQRAAAMSTGRLDLDRWDPALTAVVLVRTTATAEEFARRVAERLPGDHDPEVMGEWLGENARITAEGINAATVDRIESARETEHPLLAIGDLFTNLVAVHAVLYAQQMVTTAANFGASDAAEKAGAKTKTWQVNSGNPRSSHASLNGETVAMGEAFSNGMQFPGSPEGGAAESANCQCSVAFD